MRLLQDGVVAALAAIGLTAVIFLLVSRVVIVDCGLADEPRRVAELLCRSEYEVYLCQREELTDFFT